MSVKDEKFCHELFEQVWNEKLEHRWEKRGEFDTVGEAKSQASYRRVDQKQGGVKRRVSDRYCFWEAHVTNAQAYDEFLRMTDKFQIEMNRPEWKRVDKVTALESEERYANYRVMSNSPQVHLRGFAGYGNAERFAQERFDRSDVTIQGPCRTFRMNSVDAWADQDGLSDDYTLVCNGEFSNDEPLVDIYLGEKKLLSEKSRMDSTLLEVFRAIWPDGNPLLITKPAAKSAAISQAHPERGYAAWEGEFFQEAK